MDDFVTEIKKNLTENMRTDYKFSPRFRNLLKIIIPCCPEIQIFDRKDDGDIKFSVTTEGLGISFENYIKYKSEILTDFFANFLGELLVRENIDRFLDILTNIDSEDYPSIVNGYEHKRFGIKIYQDKFIFTFHISLLQSILTEDFKKNIEVKLR